ncbi:MAG: DUF6922 domain-containing protein [Candidatus Dormibacteraceae bacterium]
MSLPETVASIFWNIDPQLLDVKRDAKLIISTVLPRGGEEALIWLFRTYGEARVRQIVIDDADGLRTMPENVIRLWLRVLAPEHKSPVPTTVYERWAPRRFEQLARRKAQQMPGPARGQVVARIVSVDHQSGMARLLAEGLATPPEKDGDLLDIPAVQPLPGAPSPSQVLARMRADER